jgi:acetyl esterase/lipase
MNLKMSRRMFTPILLCLTAIGCNEAMPPAKPAIVVLQEPSAIVSLWNTPTTEPAAGEDVTERGKNGEHDRLVKRITNPRLRVFLADNPDPNRPAVIICPGGGYTYLTVDKEGDEVARMFNRNGVTAFVLLYRLPDGSDPLPDSTPAPIQDVHRALRLVRANSAKWKIDPTRIGILGFSAGGHVASTAATQFDAGNPTDADPINQQSSRPDFAVLMYPVVSMHAPIAHAGSCHNLLGKAPSNDWLDKFSADQNISKQTPPLFIVHAEDDKTVPVENSLRVAEAASKAGVPCDLVLLKTGGHGFGLGSHGGEPAVWPKLCIDWMRARQILSGK